MNPEIFDPKLSLKRFNLIEMNEFPFYFSCLKCKEIPEVNLSDDENLFIFCNNCKISSKEKIENVVNYSSKWISNENIKLCSKKHEKKKYSVFFCKTCKLYLCNKCLYQHQYKKKTGHKKKKKKKNLFMYFMNLLN